MPNYVIKKGTRYWVGFDRRGRSVYSSDLMEATIWRERSKADVPLDEGERAVQVQRKLVRVWEEMKK